MRTDTPATPPWGALLGCALLAGALVTAVLALGAPRTAQAAPLPDAAPVIEAGGFSLGFSFGGHRGHYGMFRGNRFHGHKFHGGFHGKRHFRKHRFRGHTARHGVRPGLGHGFRGGHFRQKGVHERGFRHDGRASWGDGFRHRDFRRRDFRHRDFRHRDFRHERFRHETFRHRGHDRRFGR